MRYALRIACIFPALLSFAACNDVITEDVPPETCISGKRWIGGDRGSPLMYPGRDCVGCHKDHDAPELVVGGTFYERFDFNGQQSEDCFGLEGVKITLTAGDGQVFETYTNEAGNFWFAARDVDIVMPITEIQTEYVDPETGAVDRPSMNFDPAYGGCARCHSRDAQPVEDADVTDPEYVIPQPNIALARGRLEDFFTQEVTTD